MGEGTSKESTEADQGSSRTFSYASTVPPWGTVLQYIRLTRAPAAKSIILVRKLVYVHLGCTSWSMTVPKERGHSSNLICQI